MDLKNKQLWAEAENLAVLYVGTENEMEREFIFEDILSLLNGYIKKVIINATKRAIMNGVHIPKEDFESRIYHYLWNAIKAYSKDTSNKFEVIAKHRFRTAEADVWRMYKKVGSEHDKDGISYESARMISLDKKIGDDVNSRTLLESVSENAPSAEEIVMESEVISDIIGNFEKVNERYATIIRYMAMGFKGDDLAKVTGEAETYDAKMRKVVSRAKTSFEKYMKERANV